MAHEKTCDIGGLLSGTAYRVTVTPQNHIGELCEQGNASIVVRTEGAATHWKH
jgi:hypothetical protein